MTLVKHCVHCAYVNKGACVSYHQRRRYKQPQTQYGNIMWTNLNIRKYLTFSVFKNTLN